MKTPLLMLFSVAVVSSAYGQGSTAPRTADTANTASVILIEPGIFLGKTVLILPPSLARDVLPGDMFFGLPAANPSFRPPLFESAATVPIDIMLPYRLQLASEQRLQTLRSILVTVQLGGVAYLAYEHIRKHGFLK